SSLRGEGSLCLCLLLPNQVPEARAGASVARRCVPRRNRMINAPSKAIAPRIKNATSVDPTLSRTQPIASGPTYPPRLPTELIHAIPAAAAVPDRKAVGNDQNVTTQDSNPTLTIVSATIAGTAFLPTAMRTSRPANASSKPPAECQRRSPLRSE